MTRQTSYRLVEYRTRPRLVAWGGKPGRDVQIGSRRDQRRYAAQRGDLGLFMRLTVEAMREAELAMQRMALLGVSAAEATANLVANVRAAEAAERRRRAR